MNHSIKIARELSLKPGQVEKTAALLQEGASVPFVARYRKEWTGNLDEVQITEIRDLLHRYEELDKRRQAIEKSLQEQGKLSAALKEQLNAAESMTTLEDLYLPFRPKRKTRASVARERGLEPLARRLLEGEPAGDLEQFASGFIKPEGPETPEDALKGARDILAETMAEDVQVREKVRELFLKQGSIVSRVLPGKEETGIKYKDYYQWSEPINSIPSHRLLALRRGEKEGVLSLDFTLPESEAIAIMDLRFTQAPQAEVTQIRLAIADSFKRLLKPSLETEVRVHTRKKADEQAIRVFAGNAKQLLLEAPMGQKRTMAIDPGFRTGCKVVCLDSQGKFLKYSTIYPHMSAESKARSAELVRDLVKTYAIEAIAIGNGTAGRETERFIRELKLPDVRIVQVNESGASIYSASEVARQEFPDQDVTVRGAISIGRRLMDPLAELVKIDPKSIGVGQYQHDVDQGKLQQALDDTVMHCVNSVGVSLNTASRQILSYVSGLGPALAGNIVEYRNTHGRFPNREALRAVPRLGEKAFVQAAGFLRIEDSDNPLDQSAVHPERYTLVEQMARDLGKEVVDLLGDPDLRARVDLKRYVSAETGLATLKDIMQELARPGRDPRQQFRAFTYTEGIEKLSDLKTGMKLSGKVTNITQFGVFVDLGVHQDGLVHLSHLADRYVKDATEVVKVNQEVEVTVLAVDQARKRISLSMRKDPFGPVGKSSGKKSPRKSPGKKRKEPVSMESRLQALKDKFS